MDTIKVMKNRRTVREFSDKPVDMDILGKIVDAARFAPSAGNLQNWKFIFVEDPKMKRKIAKISQNQTWMTSASVLIVVCNDYKEVQNLYGKQQGQLYSIQNVTLAAGHLLLAAEALGVSTAWVAVNDDFEMRAALGIPENVDPEIVIAVGYSAEVEVTTPPKKDVSEITFFEKWGRTDKTFETPKSKILDVFKSKF
ncbi:MAG: nitroreductase family protein [archaeon]